MVLSSIKNLFSGNNNLEINIIIQNVNYTNIQFTLEESNINLKCKKFNKNIFYNDIICLSDSDSYDENLIIKTKTLKILGEFSFELIYKKEKYIFFFTNWKIFNELFVGLKKLIKLTSVVYFSVKGSSIFEYSVYNTNSRIFENIKSLEKCNLKASIIILESPRLNKKTGKNLKTSNNLKIGKEKVEGYFFIISSENMIISLENITQNFYYYLDKETKSFVWSEYSSTKTSFNTFCIKFHQNLKFLEFMSKFVEAQYKNNNEFSSSENKKEDSENLSFFKNIALFSEPEINKESKTGKIKKPLIIDTSFDGDSSNGDSDEMDLNLNAGLNKNNKKVTYFKKSDSKNKHLVMNSNSVFVSRGNSLGVFDHNANFRTHILNAFNDPDKLVPYLGEKLIIKESVNDENSEISDLKHLTQELKVMDLEKGEVVEKWKINKDIKDFFNQDENCFCGVNDYSLFKIDPRTSEMVVQSKDYKTNVGFSVGMANESTGDIALANNKGDLRLYDKIDKRAKTLINGFGENVKGIDVSKNGRYILLTCSTYIMIYDLKITNYKSKVNKEELLFKRLQLKPQHASSILLNDKSTFTKSKFDASNKFILSSIGKYLIKWKLSDILEGNVYSYSLKTLNSDVVDENFILNGEDVIVALPDDVRHVNQKHLTKRFF